MAETLRGAGIEVWFDETELGGGDAWDQKIRKQIKDCALFLPIISANTQARREGYFRREWKLAFERTHDMDEALPFLVPVVIDATTETAAFVPEKFREVQWIRSAAWTGDADRAVAEYRALLRTPRFRASSLTRRAGGGKAARRDSGRCCLRARNHATRHDGNAAGARDRTRRQTCSKARPPAAATVPRVARA